MSEKPKKRIGRPPRDPSSAPAGGHAWHVGLRLNEYRERQMARILEAAQERARLADLPPQNITASSLIHSWIVQRIEEETRKLDEEDPFAAMRRIMRGVAPLAKSTAEKGASAEKKSKK